MSKLIALGGRMPYTRTHPEGRGAEYETCQISHCHKPKHEDVGIALCEAHLQKAWAAYEVITRGLGPAVAHHELEPRDVKSTSAQGHVYFARVGNLVKIGWTHDVERRMSQLHADALLFSRPGTRVLEKSMHTLFADHLAQGNEWFHYHDDILNYINQQTSR
jgi:hypothetical protein